MRSDSKELTLISYENVARYPSPGMNMPINITFSPDGEMVTYLQCSENELTHALYGVRVSDNAADCFIEIATAPNQGNTETNLSLEDKLRRERQRQLNVGITAYAWSPRSAGAKCRILYPIQGNLYMQNSIPGSLDLFFNKESTKVMGGAVDPQFSPDEKWIAFVQDREVYLIASDLDDLQRKGAGAIQITRGAREKPGFSNGLACFLTQEELSRYRGFWWSPDSSHIAFEQVDESDIEEFRIMHSGSESVGAAACENHRYPFAGKSNPRRRIGVAKIRTNADDNFHTPVWMDFESLVHDPTDFYISRVNWLPDRSLGIQILNRLQTELIFARFDVKTGRGHVLIRESSSVWMNAHYLYRNLGPDEQSSFRFIWGSERSGFMHLYLYQYDPSSGKVSAQLIRAITEGNWCVESIEGIDLINDRIYFCGTLDSPLERHLYATCLQSAQNSLPVRLTKAKGMHNVVMDRMCRYIVDVYSNLETPPKASITQIPENMHLLDQEELLAALEQSSHFLHSKIDDRVLDLLATKKLPAPRIVSFPTRDKQELLYGAIYAPDATKHGPGPYPTIVSVYGGPHVQRVAHMWAMTVDMRAQRFRDMGFAILKVDNRGSYRRGLSFEGTIKHRFGTIEIQDQQDGIQYMIKEGLAQSTRIGIYGWSYGGYLSAICLMKAPETYKVAIAGAPVTSWDGYDTCYTERYMATPELNSHGYRNGSVMEAVPKMQPHQKLLLIHGLIDENVHFRHTARLINALIQAEKDYDVLLFPNERHSPRYLKDRIYMEQRISDYIMKHL